MVAALAALLILLAVTGCASQSNDGLIGLKGVYNYSPSVIVSGTTTQIWWCGQAQNPEKKAQNTDTIQYESFDSVTKAKVGPMTVLAETPGSWDTVYTCNPKVIAGQFVNPLGDGQTYTYALYYVGLGAASLINNIGVAFSNDGMHWSKYPQPVITADSPNGFGAAQPVPFNIDHKSNLRLFYEEDYPVMHHIAATSTDGVHFTVQGTMTTLGLDSAFPNPSWGDMAYDPTVGDWYAAFNQGLRDPVTTGGFVERGQLGVELFRIPDAALLTGSTPWQQLHTFDTNASGYEANFLAAIVHDPYGNVNVGSYPTISLYVSVSNPQPQWDASPRETGMSAAPAKWAIGLDTWTPGNSLLPFTPYSNGSVQEVSTGWTSASGQFQPMPPLGHLFEAPQQGASVAFYGCKNKSSDYFVSLDNGCEGSLFLGTNGYAFSRPVAGQNLVAVYRCRDGAGHFVSQDATCGGQTSEGLLGYIPR